VLMGGAGIGDTALRADVLAIASVRLAAPVISVRREDFETVLSLAGRTHANLRYDQCVRFCRQDGWADSMSITRLSAVHQNNTDRTLVPAAGGGEWPNQAVIAQKKTLTLSRDLWLMHEAGPGLLPITGPILRCGVTTARASRSARAIVVDPVSCGQQSAN
jgi:hypothetical protein